MSGLGPPAAEVVGAGADVLRIRSGRGRAIVAGFSVAHFANHIVNILLNPLLPLIRDTFALSYAQSGFIVSAYSLSLGLANAPMGILSDRIGPRVVLAGGMILVGLAGIALALAQAYWQLLVLFVVMGVISAAYHAPAVALLSRAFPDRTRGAAMGLHTTGGSLAVFAAPLIAAYFAGTMAASDAWRAAYLWTAAIPIVCGIVLWSVAPRAEAATATHGRLAALRDVIAVFRRVGRVVALSVTFQIFYAAILAFLAIYLVDARGLDAAVAAALFAVPQAAGVVGPPVGGWLSDRIGRRAVIAIGIGVLGPAFWVFTATPTPLVAVPLVVVGLAAGMRTTVTEVLVAETAPHASRATVLGTYYLLAAEIGGLAAPALGALATAIGIAAAFSAIGAVLTALSAVAIAAAVTRRL